MKKETSLFQVSQNSLNLCRENAEEWFTGTLQDSVLSALAAAQAVIAQKAHGGLESLGKTVTAFYAQRERVHYLESAVDKRDYHRAMGLLNLARDIAVVEKINVRKINPLKKPPEIWEEENVELQKAEDNIHLIGEGLDYKELSGHGLPTAYLPRPVISRAKPKPPITSANPANSGVNAASNPFRSP
jgi:hypothetical protein